MARETPFKTTQKDFANWTSKWVNLNEIENTIEPDVIEIVSLLQVLGYKIRFFDAHDLQDIAPIQNGGRGMKMMITCGHSGLRCILERASECQCPNNVAEAAKWEISGTGPKAIKEEVNETGSDLLLPIPKATQKVIKTVMNHLFHMVKSPPNDINHNSTSTPTKYTRSPYLHRNSAMSSNVNAINPTFNIKSPETPMSPTRYRSLDTLTGTVDQIELPSPGILTKTPKKPIFPCLTMSSPNLLVSGQLAMTSSPIDSMNCLEDEYTKLKHVQELINDVVTIYEHKQKKSLLHFDVSKIKGSTESLPVIEAERIQKTCPSGSTPNISTDPKIKAVKPMCRPPIRYTSIKNTASTSQTKPSPNQIKNIPQLSQIDTSTNSLLKRTKIASISSGGKNLKYSHIKSTIPKHISKKQ